MKITSLLKTGKATLRKTSELCILPMRLTFKTEVKSDTLKPRGEFLLIFPNFNTK